MKNAVFEIVAMGLGPAVSPDGQIGLQGVKT